MAQCESAKDTEIPKGTFWWKQQIPALKNSLYQHLLDKKETSRCGYFFKQFNVNVFWARRMCGEK